VITAWEADQCHRGLAAAKDQPADRGIQGAVMGDLAMHGRSPFDKADSSE